MNNWEDLSSKRKKSRKKILEWDTNERRILIDVKNIVTKDLLTSSKQLIAFSDDYRWLLFALRRKRIPLALARALPPSPRRLPTTLPKPHIFPKRSPKWKQMRQPSAPSSLLLSLSSAHPHLRCLFLALPFPHHNFQAPPQCWLQLTQLDTIRHWAHR